MAQKNIDREVNHVQGSVGDIEKILQSKTALQEHDTVGELTRLLGGVVEKLNLLKRKVITAFVLHYFDELNDVGMWKVEMYRDRGLAYIGMRRDLNLTEICHRLMILSLLSKTAVAFYSSCICEKYIKDEKDKMKLKVAA